MSVLRAREKVAYEPAVPLSVELPTRLPSPVLPCSDVTALQHSSKLAPPYFPCLCKPHSFLIPLFLHRSSGKTTRQPKPLARMSSRWVMMSDVRFPWRLDAGSESQPAISQPLASQRISRLRNYPGVETTSPWQILAT